MKKYENFVCKNILMFAPDSFTVYYVQTLRTAGNVFFFKYVLCSITLLLLFVYLKLFTALRMLMNNYAFIFNNEYI